MRTEERITTRIITALAVGIAVAFLACIGVLVGGYVGLEPKDGAYAAESKATLGVVVITVGLIFGVRLMGRRGR